MDNKLGKSIVKVAWIFFAAMVMSITIYVWTKDRYTPSFAGKYIEQRTGIVYYEDGTPL